MKKIAYALTVILASLAAMVSAPSAQALSFYDTYMFGGLGDPPTIGVNRTYLSNTVYQRYATYIKLDRCLPSSSRLRLSYESASGWDHAVRWSAFGACDIYSDATSSGPSRVAIKIERWNMNGFLRTTPQGPCPAGSSCSPFYALNPAWSLSETPGGCGGGVTCQ